MGNSTTGRHGEGLNVFQPPPLPGMKETWRGAVDAWQERWTAGGAPVPAASLLKRLLKAPASPPLSGPFPRRALEVLRSPAFRQAIDRVARRHKAEPADVILLWARAPLADLAVGAQEATHRLLFLRAVETTVARELNRTLRPTGRRLSLAHRDRLHTELVRALARLNLADLPLGPDARAWRKSTAAWAAQPSNRRLVELAVNALVDPRAAAGTPDGALLVDA